MADDLSEPLEYNSILTETKVHYSVTTILLCIVTIIIVVNIIFYRKKLRNTIPRKLLQKIINEDVEISKDGGVIGLSRPC